MQTTFIFIAPNNLLQYEKKVIACNLSTLKKDGAGIALDAAGFIPGEKLLGATGGVIAMVGIGVASTIHSAVNGDLPVAGTVLPAVAPAAKYAGVSLLESIPGLGTLANVAITVRDAIKGNQDYEQCMAEP